MVATSFFGSALHTAKDGGEGGGNSAKSWIIVAAAVVFQMNSQCASGFDLVVAAELETML